MRLRLQKKYPGGWMTVGMIDTIGEIDWLDVFPPDQFRTLEPDVAEAANTEGVCGEISLEGALVCSRHTGHKGPHSFAPPPLKSTTIGSWPIHSRQG